MPEESEPTLVFRPRNDVVVIERVEIPWKGGLERPAQSKKAYELYCVVIAVGPKVEDLKPGMRVFGLQAGAVPIHITRPIYAISEDVLLVEVTGGEGIEAPTPKAETNLVVPPAGSRLAPPPKPRRPRKRGL